MILLQHCIVLSQKLETYKATLVLRGNRHKAEFHIYRNVAVRAALSSLGTTQIPATRTQAPAGPSQMISVARPDRLS